MNRKDVMDAQRAGFQSNASALRDAQETVGVDHSVDPMLRRAYEQMDKALELVKAERIRADSKFGFFRDYPDGCSPFQYGAATEAAVFLENLRYQNDKKIPSWKSILLEEILEAFTAPNEGALARELEQVACVAVAWREALHRREDERVLGEDFATSPAHFWKPFPSALAFRQPTLWERFKAWFTRESI